MPQFFCPDCGRSFSKERGLNRHRNYAHGSNGAEPELEPEFPAPAALITFDPFEHLAAPLRSELERLDAELADLAAQREALQARIRPIRAALEKLQPAPAKTKTQRREASAAKLRQVREFVEAHAGELGDGFLAGDLQQLMRSNGGTAPSADRVRLALLAMHQAGELRLLRASQGGGKVYGLVG